jgi:phosphohistidine phosphatase SixA
MNQMLAFRYSLRLLCATGFALLYSVTPPSLAAETPEASEVALIEALRAGGFNIYFRHAETDWSQDDDIQKADDWLSCDPTRMRQLSNEGRQNAQRVGRAIKVLGIPVSRVLASPYCRTVETAQLMNIGDVETTTDIINLRVAEYFGGRGAIVDSARMRLSTTPEPASNMVLVAHGNVARESTPAYPSEAEGIVFRPDGEGGFSVAGRLKATTWVRLVESLGNSPALK